MNAPENCPARADDIAEIDAFCDALWLEDGLAKLSLASYRSDLLLFAQWLARQGRPALISADEAALTAFIAEVAHAQLQVELVAGAPADGVLHDPLPAETV